MADLDQEVTSPATQPTAIAPVADSESVKAILSVVDALGDSMSVADREKFEGLIARARASDSAND